MTRLSERIAKLEAIRASSGVFFMISNRPPSDAECEGTIAEDEAELGRPLTGAEWQEHFERLSLAAQIAS